MLVGSVLSGCAPQLLKRVAPFLKKQCFSSRVMDTPQAEDFQLGILNMLSFSLGHSITVRRLDGTDEYIWRNPSSSKSATKEMVSDCVTDQYASIFLSDFKRVSGNYLFFMTCLRLMMPSFDDFSGLKEEALHSEGGDHFSLRNQYNELIFDRLFYPFLQSLVACHLGDTRLLSDVFDQYSELISYKNDLGQCFPHWISLIQPDAETRDALYDLLQSKSGDDTLFGVDALGNLPDVYARLTTDSALHDAMVQNILVNADVDCCRPITSRAVNFAFRDLGRRTCFLATPHFSRLGMFVSLCQMPLGTRPDISQEPLIDRDDSLVDFVVDRASELGDHELGVYLKCKPGVETALISPHTDLLPYAGVISTSRVRLDDEGSFQAVSSPRDCDIPVDFSRGILLSSVELISDLDDVYAGSLAGFINTNQTATCNCELILNVGSGALYTPMIRSSSAPIQIRAGEIVQLFLDRA